MAEPEADARTLHNAAAMAREMAKSRASVDDAFLTGLLAGVLLSMRHPARAERLHEMLLGIYSNANKMEPEALSKTWEDAVDVIAGVEKEPLDKPDANG